MDSFFLAKKSFAQDYYHLVNLDKDWSALLAHYQIEAILLPKHLPLAQAIRLLPNWRISYEDDYTILIEKSL